MLNELKKVFQRKKDFKSVTELFVKVVKGYRG